MTLDTTLETWLDSCRAEGSLSDVEIKKVLELDNPAVQLLKDFMDVCRDDIVVWMRERVKLYQKRLQRTKEKQENAKFLHNLEKNSRNVGQNG